MGEPKVKKKRKRGEGGKEKVRKKLSEKKIPRERRKGEELEKEGEKRLSASVTLSSGDNISSSVHSLFSQVITRCCLTHHLHHHHNHSTVHVL